MQSFVIEAVRNTKMHKMQTDKQINYSPQLLLSLHLYSPSNLQKGCQMHSSAERKNMCKKEVK